MKKNLIARAIYQARKNQSPIKANIRLKKNGQFSSIEGLVVDVKVNMDGGPYVVIKPNNNKHLQSISMENILSVHANNKLVK